MTWYCEKCGELNEAVHRYRFCWSCGTDKQPHPQYSNLKEFSAYIKTQKEGITLKRITLLFSIGLVIFIFFLITGLIFITQLEVGVPLHFLSVLIGAVFGMVLVSRLRNLRSYSIKPQRKILEDERAPILYLRPFKTDLESELVLGNKTLTLEELLVSTLNNIGPTVAIGVPGEELVALGAIRLYFPYRGWQEKVKALMSISQLTIIQAGFSEGVEWEISTAMKLLNPKTVVISFLCWQALRPSKCQSDYEVFLMLLERVFSAKVRLFPKQINGSYFMYFDDAWTPSLSGPTVNRNTVTKKSIRSALEPIFKTLTV